MRRSALIQGLIAGLGSVLSFGMAPRPQWRNALDDPQFVRYAARHEHMGRSRPRRQPHRPSGVAKARRAAAEAAESGAGSRLSGMGCKQVLSLSLTLSHGERGYAISPLSGRLSLPPKLLARKVFFFLPICSPPLLPPGLAPAGFFRDGYG
jgi:hypothetical protein